MEEFTKWIDDELNRKGWSRSEAARRGGISDSMFSKIFSGVTTPGLDFCRGLARAFNVELEVVLRRAGILPNVEQALGENDLLAYYRALSPEDREHVLAITYEFWSRDQARRA